MENNFDSFNLEMSSRKSSVIQERVNLISSTLYKYYLDYNHAMVNTKESFLKMIELAESIINYLKQNFASRGIPTENIYYEVDETSTVLVLNILWVSISVINKFNTTPKALYRGEVIAPMFAGRILAIAGNYNSMMQDVEKEELSMVLDKEIASLYLPPEKTQQAIVKIRHLGKKEHPINQIDVPREFLLKVIEIVCAGGSYFEENKPL